MTKQPGKPKEHILVGEAIAPPPQRAEIILPGKDNAYDRSVRGGVNAKPSKTAPKRKASEITRRPPEAAIKPAPKKAKAKKPGRKPPAPGRGIPEKKARRTPSPEERTRQLAETVVSGFTSRLTEEANARGGYLSVQDLQSMNREFEDRTVELKAALDKSFDDFVVAREKSAWYKARKSPFDRMMVKTFSAMLENDSRALGPSDTVSRRMLPGFFLALQMILGPDKLEGYQGKCRAVVKLVRKAYGGNFEWEDIYENDDARAIVIDALIDIVHKFDDMEKRADWFIDMVNSHLPPTTGETSRTEAEWMFGRAGFRRFFGALMSDLNDSLASETGRLLITRRHGVEETIELVALMKTLNGGLKKL